MDTEAIKQKLGKLRSVLSERYDVRTVGLFGSCVRGEARPDSDVDVLVSFGRPPSLLRFIELENLLSDELGVKVDLVMAEALKPAIGRRIRAELVAV